MGKNKTINNKNMINDLDQVNNWDKIKNKIIKMFQQALILLVDWEI